MSILGKYNEVVIDNNQNPPQGSSQQHSIELKSILLSKIIVKFLNSSIPKDKVYGLNYYYQVYLYRGFTFQEVEFTRYQKQLSLCHLL